MSLSICCNFSFALFFCSSWYCFRSSSCFCFKSFCCWAFCLLLWERTKTTRKNIWKVWNIFYFMMIHILVPEFNKRKRARIESNFIMKSKSLRTGKLSWKLGLTISLKTHIYIITWKLLSLANKYFPIKKNFKHF